MVSRELVVAPGEMVEVQEDLVVMAEELLVVQESTGVL